MTYHHRGMGAIASGSFPSGSRFAGGYFVTNLSGTPANAVQQLREAMQAGFRGRTLEAGWGPKYGVPSGHLYVLIETARDGITGDELNMIFSRVGAALQGRGVGSVRNTHAHQIGASGGTSPAPSAIAPSAPAAPFAPSSAPSSLSTPGASTQHFSPMPEVPVVDPMAMDTGGGFMSQRIGGIPMWGLMVGGVAVIGVVGYALVSSAKKPAVVKSNRRRRRR